VKMPPLTSTWHGLKILLGAAVLVKLVRFSWFILSSITHDKK
jgi:hypothetical protein